MELEQYSNIMGPLRQRWKIAYPPVVMDRIFQVVRELPAHSLEAVVGRFLDSGKAPTPDDFKTALRSQRTNVYQLAARADLHKCRSCDGDGYLSAIKIAGGREYSFAFRCPDPSCAPSNLETSSPRWASNFEPEYKRREHKI